MLTITNVINEQRERNREKKFGKIIKQMHIVLISCGFFVVVGGGAAAADDDGSTTKS